jgi:hypothetical protein
MEKKLKKKIAVSATVNLFLGTAQGLDALHHVDVLQHL